MSGTVGRCPNCGATLYGNERFCTTCGGPLSTGYVASDGRARILRSLAVILSVVLVVLLGICAMRLASGNVEFFGMGANGSSSSGSATTSKTHASRYEVVKGESAWTEASTTCAKRGGHLVTITSQDEMDTVIALAEAQGLRFLWIGGYVSTRDGRAAGNWVTGEEFVFQPWYPGEPSQADQDGTPEMYLMMWKPQDDGGWSFNDAFDTSFDDKEMQDWKGAIGYVCEWEDD